jgi:hypothetical protein
LNVEQTMARSTTRLVVQKADGIHVGTGFFFGYRLARGRTRVFCVTTRYLLSEALGCSLDMLVRSGADDERKLEQLNFDVTDIATCSIFHPSPGVDLAVFPIDAIFNVIAERKKLPAITIIGRDRVLPPPAYATLAPATSVVMVGYPNTAAEDGRSRVAPQRGITATNPAQLLDGKEEFALSFACYPGSGGSPVFLHRPGSDAIVLLGMLFGGADASPAGEITRRSIPTSPTLSATPQNASRLGLCLRATVLGFLDGQV